MQVTIRAGLITESGETLSGFSFEFQISPKALNEREGSSISLELSYIEQPGQSDSGKMNALASGLPHYETVPAALPQITMTVPTGVDEGFLFLSNFATGPSSTPPYLLILENSGELVYYQTLSLPGFDFKKQPNGLLTYYDIPSGSFKALDPAYEVVDSFAAGNGYPTDVHDLQVLPDNGHALLLIYDRQQMDMSQIAPGGVPTATVVGLVIQELDAAKNVVFQWRSWDHFYITDTLMSLTTQTVDYVHGNAVERDYDGNILISSRNLSEITKINRQTGEIIWRLGGKRNQFTFTNNDPNLYQHDIRRLPNGHVTLFDNGPTRSPVEYSRAVEFDLDEENKVATSVWEYRNSPDIFSEAMGSAQRLPNGNTLVGWGSTGNPAITEVKPDGTKALEMGFADSQVSYRAFRFPWEGFPNWMPTCILKSESITSTLYCSWNGATNIAYYRIYAGMDPEPTTLIGVETKTGFEMSYDVTGFLDQFCYFRIMPVDKGGHITEYSNVVFPEDAACGVMPPPIVYSIVPSSALEGSRAFSLTVEGEHFYDDSIVRWNDSPRPTTYLSPTQLLAAIAATDVVMTGTAQVNVFNPVPRGGASAYEIFGILERVRSYFLHFPILMKDNEG